MSALPASRSRTFALLLFAGTFLVTLAVVTALWVRPLLTRAGSSAGPELPRLGPAPAFSLAAHDGRALSDHDLKGSIWVADFIFLRCGSTCPVMTEAMAGLARKLRDVPEVRFVSFDVDPEHDSVTDLAAFATQRGASTLRWTFVHGKDRSTIRSLSRDGFHLAVEDGTAEDPEPILHSTRFVLVDQLGTIRGTYDGTDPASVETLAWDVRRLAKGA